MMASGALACSSLPFVSGKAQNSNGAFGRSNLWFGAKPNRRILIVEKAEIPIAEGGGDKKVTSVDLQVGHGGGGNQGTAVKRRS